ncbi:ABC transporter ATP-binding protein [Niabella beijingensis]|uniref:ABC transporter ATP-binding protein n=1 Tax=Niabella beijingensis TaxID=2872700 RepID=UPI001CBC9C1A|nr:ABC transporter ATP-binding protein [Niabella beijingensis]MBZ4188186.1 ABC transporter ATP-binding protein/permease [Niabella beijingensis]
MSKPFTKTLNLVNIVKQLWPFVKPYRTMILGTLGLTLIGSLAAQVNPLILKYTVDHVDTLLQVPDPMQEGMRLLLYISIILFTKELVNIFIQFGQKFYGEKIRINVSNRLSEAAIEKILSYGMAFYAAPENQSGRLQTRIDRGVESLTRLVQNFFIDILPLFSNALLALVIMYMANVSVGVVATVILPAYFYVSSRQAKKLQGVRRQLRRGRENKNNGLLNLIESITVIKSFAREPYEEKKQLEIQDQLTQDQLYTRKTNFRYDGIKSFIEQIGVVLIIILTTYLVLDHQISIGAIMLHIMLFNNVSAPIRQLHRIYDEVNDAFVYAEAYFQILDAEEATEQSGSYTEEVVKGDFEMQQVNFTYPNGTKALHDITLKIEGGKTTALVGLSGAGKSTILNLLNKFYVPDNGTIVLDGVGLNDYDNTILRGEIGLVLQKNHIFKGSIEDNIRYGKMNATKEEIIAAAQKAYLHDQIMELPLQYNSDAQLLSGGQQQRIAIARLFLKDPPVIFLDEPTASLDAIATEQIKNSLDAIKKNRTVVIISHSISQIIDADMIYVLKQGHVVESGTHEQLIGLNGTYREIFNASARSLNISRIAQSLN